MGKLQVWTGTGWQEIVGAQGPPGPPVNLAEDPTYQIEHTPGGVLRDVARPDDLTALAARIAALEAELDSRVAPLPTLPRFEGMISHWDVQQLAAKDGERIGSLPDLEGNANLNQAQVGRQPYFAADAVNGRPGLVFTNSRNDILTANVGTNAGPYTATVFMVVQPTRPASGNNYLFGTSATARNIYMTSDGQLGLQTSSLLTIPDMVFGQPVLITAGFNGALSSIRINGETVATGALGATSSPPTVFSLGHRAAGTAGQGLQGAIGEAIYYYRILTDAEIANVERYLMGRWGLAPANQATWYVSSTDGDDGASGRAGGDALATVGEAINRVRASGVPDATVVIHAPADRPITENSRIDLDTGTTIRLVSAISGEPWHLRGAWSYSQGGWEAMGGGVYRRPWAWPRDLAPVAIVRTLPDSEGQPTRIMSRAATATAPGPGQYGYVEGQHYYLRLPGNADPNAHHIEIAVAQHLFYVHSGTAVHMEDAVLWGSQGNIVMHAGTEAQGGAAWSTFRRCTFEFAASSGLATGQASQGVTAMYCEARYCGNDGFNHHGYLGNPAEMRLIECEGSYNGDEGVSPHDDCVLTLIGGRFHHNAYGGLTSVGNAITEVLGTAFDHNRTRDPDVAGWDSGGVSILEQSRLTSWNMQVHDHPGPGIEIDTAAGAAWTDRGHTRSTSNGAPDKS